MKKETKNKILSLLGVFTVLFAVGALLVMYLRPSPANAAMAAELNSENAADFSSIYTEGGETGFSPMIVQGFSKQSSVAAQGDVFTQTANYLTLDTMGYSWQEAFDGSVQGFPRSRPSLISGIIPSTWDSVDEEYLYEMTRAYIEFTLPDGYISGGTAVVNLTNGCSAGSFDGNDTVYELRAGLWAGQIISNTLSDTWLSAYGTSVIGTIDDSVCGGNANLPIPIDLDSTLQAGDLVKIVITHPYDGIDARTNPDANLDDYWYFVGDGELPLTAVITSGTPVVDTGIQSDFISISSTGSDFETAFDASPNPPTTTSTLSSTISLMAGIYPTATDILTPTYTIERGYVQFALPSEYTQTDKVLLKLPNGCATINPDGGTAVTYELRDGLWSGEINGLITETSSITDTWSSLYGDTILGTIDSSLCLSITGTSTITEATMMLVPITLSTTVQAGDVVKIALIHPLDGTNVITRTDFISGSQKIVVDTEEDVTAILFPFSNTRYLPLVFQSVHTTTNTTETVVSPEDQRSLLSFGYTFPTAYNGSYSTYPRWLEQLYTGASPMTWDSVDNAYHYYLIRGYFETTIPVTYHSNDPLSVKFPLGCTTDSTNGDIVVYELRSGNWGGNLHNSSERSIWNTVYGDVLGTVIASDCNGSPLTIPIDPSGRDANETMKIVIVHPNDGVDMREIEGVMPEDFWGLSVQSALLNKESLPSLPSLFQRD